MADETTEKTLPPGVAEWFDDKGNLHRGADTSPGYLAAKKRDANKAAAEAAAEDGDTDDADTGTADGDGDGDDTTETDAGDTSTVPTSGTSWR